MRFFPLRPIVTSFTAFALLACGGSSKPAEDASAAKTDAPAAEPATDSTKADAAKAEPEKKEEKASDTGMPKVVRTPKDKLTAPDIVFKFSFKESDVGIKADEKCTESSKGDGEKKSKCMAAAQKKITVDDWHFKKGDNEDWYLLGLRTTGSKVTWTHRLPVDFGKETENTIAVKIIGADKGQAAWKHPPSELNFEVPNDYQIIQKDAELGKLVFEAKISTLGDSATKPAR
jgi:hypothetical protein